MFGEIVVSAEAANIAANFLSKNGEKLTSVTQSILEITSEKILLHSRHCYKNYLETSIEINSKSRSFFFRATPVNIYSFFVPMDIEFSSKSKQEVNLNEILEIGNHIVIQASAGYGKSVFLRHLFLTAIETCPYVPVLFDLRTIAEGRGSLLETIHEKMHNYGFKQDINFFNNRVRTRTFFANA